MINLKEITSKNYEECLELQVDDNQKQFVATNTESLADAWVYYKTARPFAIYNDDTMVGFVMIDIKSNYLWRFMIDKKYQGQGYGKEAMKKVIEYVKSNFNPIAFSTSVVPDNIIAEKLYNSFGFMPNGKYEEDEKVLVLNMKEGIYDFIISQGVSKAEEIPVSSLVLQEDLQEYCKKNVCGRYNSNYTCPPAIGESKDLINILQSYKSVIVFQNIYPLEDSFDYEGMVSAGKKHKDITLKIAEKLQDQNILVLTAGGCSLCKTCGIITNEPCRSPKQALSSLEAYGVNVSQISNVSDLKYINGVNTVTYFSGVFIK